MGKREKDSDLVTKAAMRAFYSALEDKLKRFQPIDYAPFATEMMRQDFNDEKINTYFPFFRILHSIEANCTYARGQNRDAINYHKLGAVMNVWNDNSNPIFENAIKQNIHHFVLLMHREQMDLQYNHSKRETVQNQILFVSGCPIPNLSKEFIECYGLTIEKWIQLCWLTSTASYSNPNGLFTKSSIKEYEEINIDSEEIDAFFKLSSRTPKQIGIHFRKEVLSMSPEIRFLIRSVFLETPIIDFNGEDMLAPHPGLVLRHSGHGVYRLIKPLPSFDNEFGDSVQAYVGKVLKCIDSARLLMDDSEIEPLSGGNKSCDYLVELDDCILLVECKATTFVSIGLLEHVILNDGSTGKVAEGIVQLYSTANLISESMFVSRGVSSNKPVIGIVATYGELPLVNSDWYFQKFILVRAKKKLVSPIYPSEKMKDRPLVLSLSALEKLVMLINTNNISMTSLYTEKNNLPYIKVGDWLEFLRNKVRDHKDEIRSLPFVQKEFDHLLKSMTGGWLPNK